MNIYKALNEMIAYIEQHLDEKIEYEQLSKILGVDKEMTKRLFGLLCGITLSEYIRKRRLSAAGVDLINSNLRIIDIALKYGYENPTSFSRAFTLFHGVKPSEIRKNPKGLKNFPCLHFKENKVNQTDITYDIIKKDTFTLYGLGIKTDDNHISKDAPNFFSKMRKKYEMDHGPIPYGMVSYEQRFSSDNYEYWILYDKEIEGFKKITFPKSKWLVFHIPSQKAKEIQKISYQFYYEFLPSAKYKLKRLPELEHYYNGITDFLIPIE